MVVPDRSRYALVLAVVAILILGIGIWLKPAPPPQGKRVDELTVTRAELENLQQLVRRNSLRSLSSSFASIAEDAAEHIVLVQPLSVNGISVPGIGLLAAKKLDALPRKLEATTDAGMQSIAPTVWLPGLPFFVSAVPASLARNPAPTATSAPLQGGWMLVVATGTSRQPLVSPGLYDGIVAASCGPFVRHRMQITIPLVPTYLGGGLFDLQGDLHGVVLPCDDGPAVIPLSEIQNALSLAKSDTGQLLARFGLRFAPGAQSESGATVSEVWDGWPADAEGMTPGDQIIAVDGKNTPTLSDASAALLRPTTGPYSVRLRHNNSRRLVTVSLAAVAVDDSDDSRPSLLAQDESGVTVVRVPQGSSADRAGIRAADRILSIDNQLATKQLVQRTFAKFQVPAPVSVIVQRPGRRLLIVVQP